MGKTHPAKLKTCPRGLIDRRGNQHAVVFSSSRTADCHQQHAVLGIHTHLRQTASCKTLHGCSPTVSRTHTHRYPSVAKLIYFRYPAFSFLYRIHFLISLARAAREARVVRVVRRRRQRRRRSRGRPRPGSSSPWVVSTDSSSRGCTRTSGWVPHPRCTRRRSSST